MLEGGMAYHRAGRRVEAEAAYRFVLARRPDDPAALHLLGMLCYELGRLDEALELLGRSIELAPAQAQFHSNFAGVLGRCGRLAEALDHLRQCIRLEPSHSQAHNNLGVALEALGRLDEAAMAYLEAIRLRPAYAEALYNLGNVSHQLGDTAAAIQHYRQALTVNPTHANALSNYAALQAESGRAREAAAAYRELVALRPHDATAHSRLLFTLHYLPDVDAAALHAEHVAWGSAHARRHWHDRPHRNRRDAERRLRVGYVSPDFRAHPVSRFLEPILQAHNRQDVEVVCYSDVETPDAVTWRIESVADVWRTTRDLDEEELADVIRQDEVDILVDLTGHTANNRLLAFARQPAPVQVSYFGYPNTTGLDTMDYRFTDSIHDPPGVTDRYHVEQLFRLDPCCWCYQPDDPHEPSPVEPPASAGGRPTTFVCLNRPAKTTTEMAQAWAETLRRVPDSRLILLTGAHGCGSEILRSVFADLGVELDRIEFMARTNRAAYMDAYRRVDVALDTFPYNGHTTTCDALWMGVPTITLAGTTHVSRAGLDVLTQVGLQDLVADSIREYVDFAVRLSSDASRLTELRATLRHRMRSSPLRDAAGLTRRIEAAYRRMWERWCRDAAVAESPPPV